MISFRHFPKVRFYPPVWQFSGVGLLFRCALECSTCLVCHFEEILVFGGGKSRFVSPSDVVESVLTFSYFHATQCKKCKDLISQDTVRVGKMVPSPYFDGDQPNWYVNNPCQGFRGNTHISPLSPQADPEKAPSSSKTLSSLVFRIPCASNRSYLFHS